MEKKHVLSVLVKNQTGVLIRVASLFSRRGYSIESLSVSETENIETSRMTIVVRGDERTMQQAEKQLLKLWDVLEVKELNKAEAVCREQLLIKMVFDEKNRSPLIEIASLFNAKIVDVSAGTLLMELTGEPRKIDSFIEMLTPFNIKALVRTGVTALERG